jgi:hypothetical protein
MFNIRLLELESELMAKEQSKRGFVQFPHECELLLQHIEKEIAIKLADKVDSKWRGWLTFRRGPTSLILCRGQAFSSGGLFSKWQAGLDVPYGLDSINDKVRGFDISPPPELDHLRVNFGSQDGTLESTSVFLWYGENISPYRLIFMQTLDEDPEAKLNDAIVEGCQWILRRPKDKSLEEFLQSSQS